MSASRRDFIALSTLSLLGAAAGFGQNAAPSNLPPPGAPPAFGTAPAVGPVVSASDFAAAEKLVNVSFTEDERIQAASNWRTSRVVIARAPRDPDVAMVPRRALT